MAPKVKLYGIAEIAEKIGARAETVSQWRRRGEMPPPDAELKSGPVWTEDRIGEWLKRSDWEVLSVTGLPKRGAFLVRARIAWGDEFQIYVADGLAERAGLSTDEDVAALVTEHLAQHAVDRRMKDMRTGAMPYSVRWHQSPTKGRIRILPEEKEQEMSKFAIEPGQHVYLQVGAFEGTYAVEAVRPQLVELTPVAAQLAPGVQPPSYTPLPSGECGTLTVTNGGDRTRQVRIVDGGLGVTVGPRRMQIGNESGDDVCDCPRCWRESVEGKPTGTGFAVGFGPNIPKPIPTIAFECPDCGHQWDSLNFRDHALGWASS